jgi:hypothetical protein
MLVCVQGTCVSIYSQVLHLLRLLRHHPQLHCTSCHSGLIVLHTVCAVPKDSLLLGQGAVWTVPLTKVSSRSAVAAGGLYEVCRCEDNVLHIAAGQLAPARHFVKGAAGPVRTVRLLCSVEILLG